jgi:hypothetical protein
LPSKDREGRGELKKKDWTTTSKRKAGNREGGPAIYESMLKKLIKDFH